MGSGTPLLLSAQAVVNYKSCCKTLPGHLWSRGLRRPGKLGGGGGGGGGGGHAKGSTPYRYSPLTLGPPSFPSLHAISRQGPTWQEPLRAFTRVFCSSVCASADTRQRQTVLEGEGAGVVGSHHYQHGAHHRTDRPFIPSPKHGASSQSRSSSSSSSSSHGSGAAAMEEDNVIITVGRDGQVHIDQSGSWAGAGVERAGEVEGKDASARKRKRRKKKRRARDRARQTKAAD